MHFRHAQALKVSLHLCHCKQACAWACALFPVYLFLSRFVLRQEPRFQNVLELSFDFNSQGQGGVKFKVESGREVVGTQPASTACACSSVVLAVHGLRRRWSARLTGFASRRAEISSSLLLGACCARRWIRGRLWQPWVDKLAALPLPASHAAQGQWCWSRPERFCYGRVPESVPCGAAYLHPVASHDVARHTCQTSMLI